MHRLVFVLVGAGWGIYGLGVALGGFAVLFMLPELLIASVSEAFWILCSLW